jgi:hypothetical protein
VVEVVHPLRIGAGAARKEAQAFRGSRRYHL